MGKDKPVHLAFEFSLLIFEGFPTFDSWCAYKIRRIVSGVTYEHNSPSKSHIQRPKHDTIDKKVTLKVTRVWLLDNGQDCHSEKHPLKFCTWKFRKASADFLSPEVIIFKKFLKHSELYVAR